MIDIQPYMTTLVFYAGAGFFNAVHDVLAHAHGQSIFRNASPLSFWGEQSWRRKYKHKDALSKKPAFWGSTTFAVALTDGWHLAEFLQWTCVVFAIAFFPGMTISLKAVVVLMLALRSAYGLVFTIFYRFILRL